MSNPKKIIAIVLMGVFFSLYTFAQEVQPTAQLTQDEIQHMRLISEAYLKMQAHYYKPIPLERFEQFFYRNAVIATTLIKNNGDDFAKKLDTFIYATLEWMVLELRDPTDTLSKFIHKKYLKRVVRENLSSKFEGIGIEVEQRAEGFFVSKVYEKSSAEEQGVRFNDHVLMIDGQDVNGLSLKEIERLLAVPSGEKVVLSIVHEGATTVIEVTLTCRLIIIPSVSSDYFKKEKAAYIKIAEFRKETASEFKQHLTERLKKDTRGLIIDVRENDGGDMDQAVALCDIFLPADTLVCYFLKRDAGRQDQKTRSEMADLKRIKNIVVLVNNKTGSSAEIIAGTLKYYNDVILIGTRTKGMGALKNTIPLSDGSALYIITSRTYLPDGTTFDQVGIAPDIEVADHEQQLAKAKELVTASL
ncbi:MAG: PDZ domain-containing protein [Candidatus Omnitrophica bacterium]|nr:PDZ domain-containing protein [Candidatus Omnitrophota bacterium]